MTDYKLLDEDYILQKHLNSMIIDFGHSYQISLPSHADPAVFDVV